MSEIPSQEIDEILARTIAVVLATDDGTTPLEVPAQKHDAEGRKIDGHDDEPTICNPPEGADPVPRPLQVYKEKACVQWAVEAARLAGVSGIVVMTSPDLEEQVRVALGVEAGGGNSCGDLIEVIAQDRAAEAQRTHDAANFEIFRLPYGQLAAMHAAALEMQVRCGRASQGEQASQGVMSQGAAPQSETPNAYEYLLVLSCDQVLVKDRHIRETVSEMVSDPNLDIVTSWIQFFPRTPLLISRRFIESLDGSPLLSRRPDGEDRPLPIVNAIDHVFDEDELAVRPAVPVKVEEYFTELEKRKNAGEENAREKETESGADTAAGAASKSESATIANVCFDGVADTKPAAGTPDSDLAWADSFGVRCRMDFPIFFKPQNANLVYLDNAATTQRCFRALQAQRDYDESINANVYRGTYELSAASTKAFESAHERVERFIGADKGSVAFFSNTSCAMAMVAQAWAEQHLGEGDVMALSLQSHHSGIVPFQIAAQATGATIEYILYDATGRIDRMAYSQLMARKPKLVCIPHVSNVFGIVEPVEDLVEEAHAVGARVLVDAAQSMPHIPIDVEKIGADWMAFSGHKAYGPLGIGCLWCSADAVEEMEPPIGGGGTIAHVSRSWYTPRVFPISYELGTPAVSQAVGLSAALDYLETLGMDDVRRHEAILTRYLVDGLHRIDGVTVIGDHSGADGQVGLVCFTCARADTMAAVGFMGKLGIAMRGGGHCAIPLHTSLGLAGTIRASLGVYTTKADIDALLHAMEDYAALLA